MDFIELRCLMMCMLARHQKENQLPFRNAKTGRYYNRAVARRVSILGPNNYALIPKSHGAPALVFPNRHVAQGFK